MDEDKVMLALAGLLGLFMAGLVVEVPSLLGLGREDDEPDEPIEPDDEDGSLLDDEAPEVEETSLGAETIPLPQPAVVDDSHYPEDENILSQYAIDAVLGTIHSGTDAADTLIGGEGGDQLNGYAGDDTLFGKLGDDHIYGGMGEDTLAGGADDDLLNGQEDDDALWGGDGNDNLFGGLGDDLLSGGLGNDQIAGGSGNDQVFGGRGDDAIEGGYGDDILIGGGGSDTIFGDFGNDIIVGTQINIDGQDTDGRDFANGGDGDDILILGNSDFANGGEGSDSFVIGDWMEGGPEAVIQDFDATADRIVVAVDEADFMTTAITVETDADCDVSTVFLNGDAVAFVSGNGALTAEMITLVTH